MTDKTRRDLRDETNETRRDSVIQKTANNRHGKDNMAERRRG